MSANDAVEMDEESIAEFLGEGGTGVVSFASGPDEAPYSIPLSYGYDRDRGELYLRLAVGAGGEKERHLEEPVSFVTYERVDGRWTSVVATGRLEAVDDETIDDGAIDTDVLDSLRRTEIPLVNVFDRHTRKTAFRFFRLEVERLSGRREAPTES
jgi:hypothetical protein